MRTATIRQVENGYVLDLKANCSTLMDSAFIAPTETTKVFASLEDALKEIVKWMIYNMKDVQIRILV